MRQYKLKAKNTSAMCICKQTASRSQLWRNGPALLWLILYMDKGQNSQLQGTAKLGRE